jgi:6-phosphogluconolactonase
MIIQTYPDLEALSRAAAGLFVRQAKDAVQQRGRFGVALSGGTTPRRTYALLAQSPFREQVPWERTHVFWGDERCVAPDDPRSNARLAREALLDRVPVPPRQVHPISCRTSPETAAREYAAVLREYFGAGPASFDLILLGLGENGHTASLFPGDAALDERVRWTAPVLVADPDLHRVTLTASLLNQAAMVAFLVAGAAKAGMLREVLQGPRDPRRLPAHLINPEKGELYWLVDREAAAQLR